MHAQSPAANRATPVAEPIFSRTRARANVVGHPPSACVSRPHDSDDDFESDDAEGHGSGPRTPSSNRKTSVPALRDDRPSMARRSSRKVRSRVDAYCSPGFSHGDKAAQSDLCADANAGLQEVNHVLFEGERSELSSQTDRESHREDSPNPPDPDCASPVQYAERERDVLRPTSGSAERVTPIVFSLDGSAVQKRREQVLAPRKTRKSVDESGLGPVPTRPGPSVSRHLSGQSSTRKRGRQLASLFTSDSDDAAEPRASSTTKERLGSSKRVVPDPPTALRGTSARNKSRSGYSPSSMERTGGGGRSSSPIAPVVRGSGGSTVQLPSRVSTRKRRRIVCSSSADDDGDCVQIYSSGAVEEEERVSLEPTEDQFHTPLETRRLSLNAPLLSGNTKRASSSPIVIDENSIVEVAGDSRDGEEDSSSSVIVRKSARLRSKSQILNLTPSNSASPPSARRKGRLARLQTRGSSDNEEMDSFALGQSHSNAEPVLRRQDAENAEAPNHVPNAHHTPNGTRKSSGWFDERHIDQFSSSSGEVVKEVKKTPPNVRRMQPLLDSGSTKKLARLRLNLVKDFSDEEDNGKNDRISIDGTPTESPRAGASGYVIPVVDTADNDGDMEILDLIDDEDGDDNKRSNDEDVIREVTPGVAAPGTSIQEINDDTPPPFNLHALCNSCEGILQMVERLGETYVLERVSNAQKDGRRIIGGEELGVEDMVPNGDVFSKFTQTVVASDIGRVRPERSVTEQALRGEFKFNYRGREKEGSTSRGRGGWRGRGKGIRKRRGSKARSGAAPRGRASNTRRRN